MPNSILTSYGSNIAQQELQLQYVLKWTVSDKFLEFYTHAILNIREKNVVQQVYSREHVIASLLAICLKF